MFARPTLRCARAATPFKQSIRGYASEPAASKGNSYAIYGVAGVGVLAGAYLSRNAFGSSAVADSKDAPKAFQGGDQGFISLKLDKAEDLSHNTKKLRFSLPEKDQVSGLPIASALLSKFKTDDMEKAVLRPYTPVSDEGERGFIDFVVKKYPNGPMSEHIHALKPGDTLDLKGPLPKYPMEENKHDHVVMIAGGTGITPMYQVMRYIFKNPNDKTKVSLIFGNVAEEDILLRKELNELENTYPRRFRAFYTLDKPPQNWDQGKGFITKEVLKSVLPEPKEENIKIFVCGPPGLYKAISGPKNSPQDQGELTGLLKELGYSKDQVYKF